MGHDVTKLHFLASELFRFINLGHDVTPLAEMINNSFKKIIAATLGGTVLIFIVVLAIIIRKCRSSQWMWERVSVVEEADVAEENY